ncbi:MAG: DUF488 family protein [Calditrichaeota bacterium]|nr:DUF488 family protein [Calditrichota bacterium]
MQEDLIRTKRVYADAAATDGLRILVDRLWPRGLTKEKAAADVWLKDIAPSNALRKWSGHDPEKWEEFKVRYFIELDENPEAIKIMQGHLKSGPVTFLFGARDEHFNQAVALKEYLEINFLKNV